MVAVVVATLAAGVAGFVVLPRAGFALAGAGAPSRAAHLPWIAVALFAVSWWLPNPALAHTATFTQHAVGGGAACAVAALHIALNARVTSPLLRIALAYATAAALGAAVELAELAIDTVRGTALNGDSTWDLLANTCGAVLGALVLEAVLLARGRARAPSPEHR